MWCVCWEGGGSQSSLGASRKVYKMGVTLLLLFWNALGQDDELSSLRITLEGGRTAQ